MESHSRKEDKKPFKNWKRTKIKLLFTNFLISSQFEAPIYITQTSTNESEKGIVIIYLCFLMPLILTAILFVYVGTTQLEISSTLHQICRTELLAIQDKLSHRLHKTMMSESSTEKRQDRSTIDLERVKRQVKERLFKFKNKTRFLMDISSIEVISIVSSSDSHDTTQNQLPPQPLAYQVNSWRSQQLSLYWHYQIQLASTLIFLNHWQSFFYGQCATALAKEKPWKPVLIEVKSYWKSS